MKAYNKILVFGILIFMGSIIRVHAQKSPMSVGAAKVSITPAPKDLPERYTGIHDSIFSRAVVIENRGQTVAFITVDVGGIRNELASNLIERIEKETGIPKNNIMLTATHTHSVPFNIHGEAYEGSIVQSVRLAKSKLRPATVSYGEGVSYINVNRNIIDPKTRRWWEGPNYDGPSDKTVAVVAFHDLEGKPIALYYNYAMHAVISGMFDQVSGDVPGAASRYLENHFNNDVVAVWSTGACGDQNPIYYNQTYELREIRVKDYEKKGIDISNKMPPGGEGLNRENLQVKTLIREQEQMLLSMGQFLGEEVLHVVRGMNRTLADPKIFVGRKTVTCPGRNRLDEGRAGYPGTYEDADPIPIDLGLIVLGDIAFTSVNAEIFNPIFTRLRDKSPYANVMMLTLTNGFARSGYIPHDEAFGTYTFEVVSSKLQPGCAENAIINGLLDMMYDSEKQDMGR